MKLAFGDASESIRERLVRSFRVEREFVHGRLGNVYTMHFGRVGLDEHSNAVLILDAYTDIHPKHPLRVEWCRRLEAAFESNKWENVPFLVYYLGSYQDNNDSNEDQTQEPTTAKHKLALIPQASFLPYQRKETEKELIPTSIQHKLLMDRPLSDEETKTWNICREQVKAQQAGQTWRPPFIISYPEEAIVDELLAANVQPVVADPLWKTRVYVYLPRMKAYFPGIVADIRKNITFHNILYDDNETDWLDLTLETFKCIGSNVLEPKCRIAVYWPGEKKFYEGTIVDVRTDTTFYKVDFEDGDEAWLPLHESDYSLNPPAGPSKTKNQTLCVETKEPVVVDTKEGDTKANLSPESTALDPSPSNSLKERTREDGSVLPKKPARKDKNGYFIRPTGRAVLGCVWNSRTGVWVKDCIGSPQGLGKRPQPDQEPHVPNKVTKSTIETSATKRILNQKETLSPHVQNATPISVSPSSAEKVGKSPIEVFPESIQVQKNVSGLPSETTGRTTMEANVYLRQLQEYFPMQDDISDERLERVKQILLSLIECNITYSPEENELYQALRKMSKRPNLIALKEPSRQLFEKIRMAYRNSLLENWRSSVEQNDIEALTNSTRRFHEQVIMPKKPLALTMEFVQGNRLIDLVQDSKSICAQLQIDPPEAVVALEKMVTP